ncbi:MAG: hypothetical protein AB7O21_10165 [Gammaproteobacteria bacterium]
MADQRFDIVFAGQVLAGADPAVMKAGLAQLFKVDAARVEALCATRTVIKKGVDAETARNYQAALAKVGASVEIVTQGAPAAAPAPPAAAAGAAPAAAPPPVPAAVPLTISEPGVLLVEPTRVTAPEFDLSGMSVAEVGALLVEAIPTPEPEYDLSAFALAPAGTPLDDSPPPPPADIDTSGLSLSPPGS